MQSDFVATMLTTMLMLQK